MKNYVLRFANDQISAYWKVAKNNPELANDKINKISRIVTFCERGMITDFEAVSAIVDTVREEA